MERWKDIPSSPGYQASSYGHVRSVDREVAVGNQVRRYRGKVLAPTSNQYGHLKVFVAAQDGGRKPRYIHALVAEAFIGPRPDSALVTHADGNPAHNAPENLRYATAAENSADMIAHGTRAYGSVHGQAKLTARDVATIRDRLHLGESQASIAADFGVARSTISAIATGRSRLFDAHSNAPAQFVGRAA